MRNYYKICICNYNSFVNSIDNQINSGKKEHTTYIFIYFVLKIGKNEFFINEDTHKDVFKDIQKRMPYNLNQMWIEIQQKISLFFYSMKFENYKFDEFIEILTIINRSV
jgi:hypothetical protein